MENNWSFEKINKLIELNIEESLNLEFKSADALGKSDLKKKEISKDVAAIANSDGGTIIYGIEEDNHVASKISFIDGSIYTKEWLEHVISSNIHQKIQNIRIYPIRFDNEIEKSIYVVEVPKSEFSPHMSKDKRYYRRYNFESIPMEEYEVRRFYSSEKRTILEIGKNEFGIVTLNENHSRIIGVSLSFEVKNIGAAQENNLKLQVRVPAIIGLPMQEEDQLKIVNGDQGIFVYSTFKSFSLFQGESIMIGGVYFNLENHQIEDLNIDKEIVTILYYSSGTDQKKLSFKDIYSKAIE